MSEPRDLNDPEVSSQFAESKRLAKEKGTAPGIDPETGERAAVTYRQLFNETGDEQAAKAIFEDVARAGGFGNVDLDQSLDIRSLKRSVQEHKQSAESGVDFKTGGDLDRFGKHHHEQAAQHQDNLVNAVGEALERLKKG
jgi:hypothetical protein